jgi:hypothetical protein
MLGESFFFKRAVEQFFVEESMLLPLPSVSHPTIFHEGLWWPKGEKNWPCIWGWAWLLLLLLQRLGLGGLFCFFGRLCWLGLQLLWLGLQLLQQRPPKKLLLTAHLRQERRAIECANLLKKYFTQSGEP